METTGRRGMFTTGFAICVPILLPIITHGLIYRFWTTHGTDVVDRNKCKCPCWDTLFKGTYETFPAGYHHIYFNITANTAKIWAVTVLVIIVTYETFRHMATLLSRGRARLDFVVLLLSAIYPHYYSWWMYFNYWNDDYYEQWWHQFMFSTTELLSTVLVLRCMDKERQPHPRLFLIISLVAGFHILASGLDQFVKNVFLGSGLNFQWTRDIAFMVPDLFHLFLPLRHVRAALTQDCDNGAIPNGFPTQRYNTSTFSRDLIYGAFTLTYLLVLTHFL